MIVVYKAKAIRELLTPEELNKLVEDFKQYKNEGTRPDTFGRDAAYNHPHSLPSIRHEEVQHIHLQDESSNWGIRTIQYHRTSDTHLVYCQGALNDDHFLLITILQPDAHNQAKNNDVMSAIASQAEVFRNKH
ncbi:type II toxin-antitoxin system YafO family toxin [Marinobacter halodurans]|uniref:Type II toxin-antitoxin system YafO family toxin n=1 Tax=Marinobacter halodurans TaxID=2528979 RepID=A0ABY1ZMA6_9GAMM|nr:type II toxin-antitoxin system YafO family toxin [Marinobacter halodurans]TBW57392.1 type II toxin-antitoxin system YafO family toxin [Marinobacter halodurans]